MPALLIECQHVAVLSVRREPAPFEFEALSSVRCFLIAASEQENGCALAQRLSRSSIPCLLLY